ncbi:hypothetical protein BC943DRAFT_349238 [Umbelopsis sp. AD052]|nr:hypothetical protein BC943DRAFT_349238 [Umbelopsis sp. AD052]
MSNTFDEFRKAGWNLTEEGVTLLKEWTELENPTFDDCLSVALNSDMRQFCKGGIGKEMPQVIAAPLVLQLQEVVNIATPMQHQMEHPRLLRATFTDGGKKKIKGVEMRGKVDGLKLSTPPGTKFIVTADITVEEDLLMLGPGVLKNIGGHVEAMVNEWKASKQFITRSAGSKAKNSSEGDKEDDSRPPPFVPYKLTNATAKPILPSVSKDKKKDGDHKKESNKEKGSNVDKSNRSNTKLSAEAKEFKMGNKDIKSKESDQQSGQSKNKKNLGKGSQPKGNTANADQANQTEVQKKEKKGAKNAPKPKKSDASTSDQKPKKESTKATKSIDGPINGIAGEAPKQVEAVSKAKKPPTKKQNGKAKDPSSAVDESNKGETKSVRATKPAKPKRPEQQYYQPKPRVAAEDISNVGKNDTAQSGNNDNRKAQPPSLPADLSNASSFNEQHAHQNENIPEIRSSERGRGRGRGRGHSNRGRGRGGRGGDSHNAGSQPI